MSSDTNIQIGFIGQQATRNKLGSIGNEKQIDTNYTSRTVRTTHGDNQQETTIMNGHTGLATTNDHEIQELGAQPRTRPSQQDKRKMVSISEAARIRHKEGWSRRARWCARPPRDSTTADVVESGQRRKALRRTIWVSLLLFCAVVRLGGGSGKGRRRGLHLRTNNRERERRSMETSSLHTATSALPVTFTELIHRGGNMSSRVGGTRREHGFEGVRSDNSEGDIFFYIIIIKIVLLIIR
jgi:hypothetical protein